MPANAADLRQQIEALDELGRLAAACREADEVLEAARAARAAGIVRYAGLLEQAQIAEAVGLSVPRVQQLVAEGRSR